LNITSQILRAGDSWNWTETIAGYAASDYSLKIYLTNKDCSSPITIEAVTTDGTFALSMTAAATAVIAPGTYDVYYRLTALADESVTTLPEVLNIEVLPDYSAAGVDTRDYWTRIYENLKAAYERLSQQEVSEVTVDGKTWKYTQLNDLRKQMLIAGKRSSGKTFHKRILIQPTNE
jgi:hypothetical protein